MKKRQKSKKATTPVKESKLPTVENLTTITDKRTGGSVNIIGITYQTLYAAHILLKQFAGKSSETQVRLEGLEDIDLNRGKLTLKNIELCQLKYSVNSLDAAGFWEMGVLKNFLEVHLQEKDFKFRLIYNMRIATGHLESLVSNNLNDASRDHWHNKIKSLSLYHKDLDIDAFLDKISFEKISADSLYSQSVNLLLDKYAVNPGTELQYLKSVFYHALEWSKDRATVNYALFHRTIQQVTDALYKGPVNPAVANGWIIPVKFQFSTGTTASEYFEGKAARPEHIAQQLPARRPIWEKHIKDQLSKTDVVVIKSSSGQGKSTLAWQTAFNESGHYTIYQMHHAQQAEYTEPIVDFLKSRVTIGESPLIVIDGLDQQLQYWSSVAIRTADLPVKFIITTREEDWYAYSSDLSRINLQITNISLNEEEAKNIYQQLKERNKVHAENRNWQTPWEKVKDKGLLIEYAYLLTRGQMIGDRLLHQIRKLNTGERNSAAKIELLRMIGLADILGLKLRSKSLIAHVQQIVGITGDRSELLKELELEYFIKIGEKDVEGLHPVRSAHLVRLLHEFVVIEETLISLLTILDPVYYAQFASGALDQVEETQRRVFLKQVAAIMAEKSMNDMVAVINGLMKREPQRYWEANREIFDEVYQIGGIEIFIIDTLPFMHLNMISNLQNNLGQEYRNPSVLQQRLDKLQKYNFQESDVAQFIRFLQDALGSTEIKDHQGLSSLLKWTNKVDPQSSVNMNINENDLAATMKADGLAAANELFFYFRKAYPQRYQQFTTKNKKEILSWLKSRTDTVVAEEKDRSLYLKYIFDPDNLKVSDQSVSRIECFHSFLPDYEKYHTDLIYLPFPNEELYKVFRMDAHKAMSPVNLFDPFEVEINQSWSNNILKNYETQSVYEWQSEFLKLRKSGLEFVKRCTQFFEFLAEHNEARKKATVGTLIELGEQVLAISRTRKRFPDQGMRNEEPAFRKHFKELDEWVLGLQNFINQFSKIVLNEEHHHIALINMKKMVLKLHASQQNFHTIAGEGFRYFDLGELEAEERLWYNRLLATVEYFVTFRDNRVTFAKSAVKEWWDNNHLERLLILKEALKIVGKSGDYVFHAPTALLEDEYGKTAVIGVEALSEDPAELDQQMFNMLWGLAPLSTLDILTYDVIIIKGSAAIGGFRVQKIFLEGLMRLNETGEFEPMDFGNPIPLNLEPEAVALLEGISIPDITALNLTQSYSKVVIDLWRFQQYRQRLDSNNSIEKNWLTELSQVYTNKISEQLSAIKAESIAEHELLSKMVDQVMHQNKDLNKEAYIDMLNKKVTEVNLAIKRLIDHKTDTA